VFSPQLYPDLLAGGEDLTQRRRERRKKMLFSSALLRVLCVSALKLV
jgi:hypothetical protein